MVTSARVGEEPASDGDRRAWLDALAELEAPARAVLAGVAWILGDRSGAGSGLVDLFGVEPFDAARLPPPPPGNEPVLLGQAHEALASRGEQRARGAWYTPERVARALVAAALEGTPDRPLRICDPAVGGGVFLVAAADHQVAAGADPARVLAGLRGADIDGLAADVARASLGLWAGRAGLARPGRLSAQIAEADTLLERPAGWAPRSFDAVIGNPPFLGQLSADTARTRTRAQALADRFGPTVSPYVDDSALFLLLATELVGPGGRVMLIQPQSVLAARDAGAVRRAVAEQLSLRGLWVAAGDVFGTASVRVCAPVLERRPGLDRVGLWAGDPPRPVGHCAAPDEPDRWVQVAARAQGVPSVAVPKSPVLVLGDVARVVAGFRDEYYGLVPGVVEDNGDDKLRPLVTSGQIDPGRRVIDHRGVRFAKQAWRRPAVVAARADNPRARSWLITTDGPKVLVASQTKVIEAVADRAGRTVPSTPVVAVLPEHWSLTELVTVLLSPWATAWVVSRAVGTGLASEAVRISAGQLADLPLPVDRPALDGAEPFVDAAESARTEADWKAALVALAEITNRAYRVGPHEADLLTSWWVARLPPFRNTHQSD